MGHCMCKVKIVSQRGLTHRELPPDSVLPPCSTVTGSIFQLVVLVNSDSVLFPAAADY